jgi:acetyltransferase-like isoleucine patch superfamily enzyme
MSRTRDEGWGLIIVTADTEWAPAEIVAYMREILDEYGIRATFFCTNERDRAINNHELAIHPNFSSRETEEDTVRQLLRLFPDAKGARAHCSYLHTRLTELYSRCGIRYDSSYVLPQKITPFPLFGVLEIPMYWMDNYAFTCDRRTFSPSYLKESAVSETGDVLVFNFHPVHVYLNTDSLERYEQAKQYYSNPEMLWKLRNRQRLGTHDCLIALLESLRKEDQRAHTMDEVLQSVDSKASS